MTRSEADDTLRALVGTEAARALHALLESEEERVKNALTQAGGDEVLKLQGEYRAVQRLKKALTPATRAAPSPYHY